MLAVLAAAYLALPSPALERSRSLSMLVLARDGSILRGFLSADGKWRLPVSAQSVDPVYRRMLIATEDRRFAEHKGVDPLAALRALGQLARHRHVVSGASTLTMQAVRLLERRPRNLSSKLVEMAEALSLERQLPKDDILSIYLTLAPFGGNLEGVRAASLAYFGKEPSHLSPAEAALLVALPRSPEHLRPDRHPAAAGLARDTVLARMRERGVISDSTGARPVPSRSRSTGWRCRFMPRIWR
ncbi:MAG TPA: transglycosylase domain-containing protein, partial [Stellaceae bacterium]